MGARCGEPSRMPLGGRFWAWFSRSGETPARPHRMNGHATRRLRIAIVAPPYYSVPPTSYGGIELMCHVLIEGLVDRGHDITLIAVGEARTRARFIQTFAEPQQEATANDAETEIIHAALAASALAGVDVDVVHDHTRAGPLTAASRRVPTIVTVHAALSGSRPGRGGSVLSQSRKRSAATHRTSTGLQPFITASPSTTTRSAPSRRITSFTSADLAPIRERTSPSTRLAPPAAGLVLPEARPAPPRHGTLIP